MLIIESKRQGDERGELPEWVTSDRDEARVSGRGRAKKGRQMPEREEADEAGNVSL